jgi:hypothetical protein
MAEIKSDGPHVHEPCSRCGVVEGEIDGLCAECVTDKPLPRRKRNATPGAQAKWDAGRQRSIRQALDVARDHADNKSPYRAIVRTVEVPTRPTPRGGEVMAVRLELECGHLVPPPGGALVDRTQPGQTRRCRPCLDGIAVK